MFEFDVTDELKKDLIKISKKNSSLSISINKKMCEIVSRDIITINSYKNLRYDFKGYKRVHITGNFVLLFHVDYEHNFILFTSIKHRDDVYIR